MRGGEAAKFLWSLLVALILTGLIVTFEGQIRGWFQGVYGLIPNIIGAIIIGGIGSSAYYTALKLGYIGGDQRKAILELFGGGVLVLTFCIVGGSIAAIFQLAQLGVFAPVQAFVLGITWPTLVSQYVAGAKESDKQKFIDTVNKLVAQN